MGREKASLRCDPNAMTGAEVRYDYSVLPRNFSEPELRRLLSTTQKHHWANVSRWDDAANLEWTLRHFLAVKLILGATLSITSLRHSMRVNLRIVEPYLAYYSLLNCSRALVLTDPTQQWRNGELFRSSHDKSLKAATQLLQRLNRRLAGEYADQATFLKDWRELFSYSFPALGLGLGRGAFEFKLDGLLWICRVLVELAEMNSQILERAIDDEQPPVRLDSERLTPAAKYTIGKFRVLDTDDAYRLDKIQRKQPYPVALDVMAEYGMAEDFFGAWCARGPEKKSAPYDPDDDWYALFSFG